MQKDIFSTPILFLIFNRPEMTQQVFNRIRRVKPNRLFIAADGPRTDRIGEKEKCLKTRAIIDQIDWDCKVATLFRDDNLGCKKAVSSAINWFFENVNEGIILEDDCVPHDDFFRFCTVLLDKYRNNHKIMHISGDNFQFGKKRGEASYYFSIYNHIWGWATWKRAWKDYDVDMKDFPGFKSRNDIQKIFSDPAMQEHWMNIFQSVYEGKIDTWDYQWTYCMFNKNGLAILPNKNLVSNIGFNHDATHTKDRKSRFSNLKTFKIGNIIFPLKIIRDIKADDFTSKTLFNPTPKVRFKKWIKNSIRNAIAKKKQEKEFERLKKLPRYTKNITNVLGKPLRIVDSASFLFMFQEINKKEIYKFKADGTSPYIIDCGANIGLSIIYFKNLYPDAEILGFEPDPKIFKVLKHNIQSFNLSNIKLINKGLWNEETILNFYVEGADGGRIELANQNSDYHYRKIKTVRLKNYLTKSVDFLKIDIEGAEVEVLSDCKDLSMVSNLFIEYHSFIGKKQHLHQIIKQLTDAGFRLHINTPGLSSSQPFLKKTISADMDMQLNIYAFRE